MCFTDELEGLCLFKHSVHLLIPTRDWWVVAFRGKLSADVLILRLGLYRCWLVVAYMPWVYLFVFDFVHSKIGKFESIETNS